MFTNFLSKAFVQQVLISAGTLVLGFLTLASGADTDQYRWSVQYLIDNSQSVFGRSQAIYPRNNRSLAITHDRRFLYAGYLWSFNGEGEPQKRDYFSGKGELRKIDLGIADYEQATIAVLPNVVPKALAVDDDGRVYVALMTQITIYDADLAHELEVIPTSSCEGIAVVRGPSGFVLYGSERERHLLRRWEISANKDSISNVKQTGFDGGTGEIAIPDAVSLRGVAVDTRGRIWMADLEGNQVFRVEPSGRDLKVMKLPSPMEIVFDGTKGYVTLSKDRTVAIIDDDMNLLGTLNVPWKELELEPLGNQHKGILAGIVADPGKGFYVANAIGQTAGQRSTYGRVDDAADVINGKLYTDSYADDNEPILHAVVFDSAGQPAPGAADSNNSSNPGGQSNPSDLSKQANPSNLSPSPAAQ